MAALGWLLNLGFAGGVAATPPEITYTVSPTLRRSTPPEDSAIRRSPGTDSVLRAQPSGDTDTLRRS